MSIEITGLTKKFGATTAVSDVNLHVHDGQMLVLLGPSGCGKTTIMRCIAGLDNPSEGCIAIGGRPVFDKQAGLNVPIKERRVGMVFQSYAIWPHLNVFKNISFPLEVAGFPRDQVRQRVLEMISMVGLEGMADRGSSYLSGGQMQRVALARSLVMRPSVLLLDEPMSNLDARLRDRLRVQLRELQMELKITSVYVTHDQQEALALADQIAVLRLGTVLQVGDPVSIYRRPQTATIAEFLGYSNVFDAAVEARGDGFCRVKLRSSGDLLLSREFSSDTDSDLCACVRPNDVVIKPYTNSTGTASCENDFLGDITFASFEGSHMHFHVRTSSGAVWDVIDNTVSTEIKVGSRVTLEILPSQLLLLPKD